MVLTNRVSAEERAKLEALGFQRFEIWLPDLRNGSTKATAEAEAKRIAFADEEDSVMEWVEKLQDDIWQEEDGQ